jgi:hypothetical protein
MSDEVTVTITYLDSDATQTLTTSEAEAKRFLDQVMRCLNNNMHLWYNSEAGTVLIPHSVLTKTVFTI